MKIQIEERRNYMYVKVQEKRLDILSASKLKEELFVLIQNQENKNIVLNICNCSFCDASGLSAFVSIHNMCEKSGGILIITGIQANNEKLVNICKLDTVWNIAKDVNEAETLLKRRICDSILRDKSHYCQEELQDYLRIENPNLRT